MTDLPTLRNLKCNIREKGCGLCDNCYNRNVILAHAAAHQKEMDGNTVLGKEYREALSARDAVLALLPKEAKK